MPTPYFNLPLYTVSDTAALDTLLNGQSSALDTALLGNIWKFSGTAANITSITAPRLRAGIEYFATDTGVLWKYDGSNWITNENGMYLIRPGSVVNAVINTDGSITPNTSVNRFSVNDAFSSKYFRYLITFEYSMSVADGSAFFLRKAGTDLSTANYGHSRIWSSSGTPSSDTQSSQGAWSGSAIAASVHVGEIRLTNPATAGGIKAYSLISATGVPTGQNNIHGINGDSTAVNTSYDGFSFELFSGRTFATTFSKRFKIYGLA